MRLREILAKDRVSISLQASDKPTVLKHLAHLFAQSVPSLDEAKVEGVLRSRESLASTGVGDGVAIPHAHMHGIGQVHAALAVAKQGVPFDCIDGGPAHIFLAILAPDEQTGEHLKALARVSRLMRDPHVRQRLMTADSADAAFSIVLEEDDRH